tara:strand:+ start:434 stop:556 length:123 start_codon:yes stop_codon:yes gene_type:complete
MKININKLVIDDDGEIKLPKRKRKKSVKKHREEKDHPNKK